MYDLIPFSILFSMQILFFALVYRILGVKIDGHDGKKDLSVNECLRYPLIIFENAIGNI